MKYQKQGGVNGKWVKGAEIVSGTKCKLVSETEPVESQFEDKDGKKKIQNVAKIRFENIQETLNISINRASLNALIDAFGDDSKNWQGHYLNAQTEKVVVGGKRVVAVYLIPDGYELGEDDNGYMVITKKGQVVSEVPEEEDVKPEEIPF